MLVTQERYKNPSDRVTYLGTINHIDIPVVRSAVLLVGQAMLGNGGGRWNTGSKDSYPDRATYLAQSTTSILPWYVPRSFSLVKPCWVTDVVDGTQVPKTPIRTAPRTLKENLRGATIANLQQANKKRKNPWNRKETKGFRQSGRRDSNPRPLPPQGSALARLRYGPMFR